MKRLTVIPDPKKPEISYAIIGEYIDYKNNYIEIKNDCYNTVALLPIECIVIEERDTTSDRDEKLKKLKETRDIMNELVGLIREMKKHENG